MELLAVAALALAVVLVREIVRGRGRPRVRAMFDLANQPAGTTLAGLVAMYLALAGLAFAYVKIYGQPGGETYYGVGEVLPDGAAVGKLERGDRIDRIDGEPVRIGGRRLVDHVNRKAGAPFELEVIRRGERHRVRIEPKQRGDKWLIGIRPVVDEDRRDDGAVAFALRYPATHVAQLARDIRRWTSDVEVGGVVRITEEFRQAGTGVVIFLGALWLAGHAFLLFCVVDLIRLALAIRDRLRA